MTMPLQGPGSKVNVPTVGGTAMAVDFAGILVGCEGGLVSRLALNPKAAQPVVTGDSKLRWEKAANDVLLELPSDARFKLRRHVEHWLSGTRKQVVTPKDIFASKPKSAHIFPVPLQAVNDFEAHASSVVLIHLNTNRYSSNCR